MTDAEAAHCWRAFSSNRMNFCWSPECDGSIKWVNFLRMPEPDVSAAALKKAGAIEQLEAWLLQQEPERSKPEDEPK